MQRLSITPRSDWLEKIAAMGLTFNFISPDGKQIDTSEPYWIEDAYYCFDGPTIRSIKRATLELHQLCLKAVDHIVKSDELLQKFAIPQPYWELVRRSWERKDPSVYGRFDLVLDSTGTPRLLEYNADTPTSLVESSLVSASWFLEQFGNKDDVFQFNILHKLLVSAWSKAKKRFQSELGTEELPPLYFSCVPNHEEDLRTVQYIASTAEDAGFDVRLITIDNIGWNGESFVDLDDKPIQLWFKLYPWEFLVRESFGPNLLATERQLHIVEPAWKMVLSNKAILPVLWHLFPGHPNLLPAYFTEEEAKAKLPDGYVRKPLLGREGANITLKLGEDSVENTGGVYGAEGYVYQKVCIPPKFGQYHAIIGSWVVDGEPAGICVREDKSPVTRNTSHFVPHAHLK